MERDGGVMVEKKDEHKEEVNRKRRRGGMECGKPGVAVWMKGV